MKEVLKNIRVIELASFMSGPFASMILGDLGAEIIKIEPPKVGDPSRRVPPYFHEGESMYYISLNRNKRSMTLNLNMDEGRELFYRLVKKVDVVIDNFRPGVLTKLGADYEHLKRIKPEIVCCSITAFGSHGPYGRRPAYDLIIQALSGVMSMTGERSTGPMRLSVPMGDLAGSMWAVVGILAALYHRQKTGKGQLVDIALLDSLVSLVTYPALYYSYGGEVAKPIGSGHQSIVPFQVFKTKDYYLSVACPREKFWSLLCKALGVTELTSDPRFVQMEDRLKNKEELDAILNPIFSRKTNTEWEQILVRAGVPCASVNTIDKVFIDPAVQRRGMVISVDHFGETLSLFGNPIHFSETPIEEYRTPPCLGADNHEILSDLLGYSSEEIEMLEDEGVV